MEKPRRLNEDGGAWSEAVWITGIGMPRTTYPVALVAPSPRQMP